MLVSNSINFYYLKTIKHLSSQIFRCSLYFSATLYWSFHVFSLEFFHHKIHYSKKESLLQDHLDGAHMPSARGMAFKFYQILEIFHQLMALEFLECLGMLLNLLLIEFLFSIQVVIVPQCKRAWIYPERPFMKHQQCFHFCLVGFPKNFLVLNSFLVNRNFFLSIS